MSCFAPFNEQQLEKLVNIVALHGGHKKTTTRQETKWINISTALNGDALFQGFKMLKWQAMQSNFVALVGDVLKRHAVSDDRTNLSDRDETIPTWELKIMQLEEDRVAAEEAAAFGKLNREGTTRRMAGHESALTSSFSSAAASSRGDTNNNVTSVSPPSASSAKKRKRGECDAAFAAFKELMGDDEDNFGMKQNRLMQKIRFYEENLRRPQEESSAEERDEWKAVVKQAYAELRAL